jgi:hypothetical protein
MEILKQKQLLKAHNPSLEKLCGTEFSSLFSQNSLPLLLGENQFCKTDSLNRIYVRMVLSATKKTTVQQSSPATNVISLDLFSHEESA